MLVPNARMDEAIAVAREAAGAVTVGDPDDKTAIGPVASKAQFDKIQGLIQKGIDEGATLVAGGTGRPDGLDTGYYVKPTVFANVTNDMTIAREEIFGPVLCILGYDDLDQAVEIANDTDYGLGRLRLGRRPGRGARGGPPDPRRLGRDQPRLRHERAVRRLQAQRQRARVGRVRVRRVPGDQGGAGLSCPSRAWFKDVSAAAVRRVSLCGARRSPGRRRPRTRRPWRTTTRRWPGTPRTSTPPRMLPGRPSGEVTMSSGKCLVIGVRMKPGCSELTRML